MHEPYWGWKHAMQCTEKELRFWYSEMNPRNIILRRERVQREKVMRLRGIITGKPKAMPAAAGEGQRSESDAPPPEGSTTASASSASSSAAAIPPSRPPAWTLTCGHRKDDLREDCSICQVYYMATEASAPAAAGGPAASTPARGNVAGTIGKAPMPAIAEEPYAGGSSAAGPPSAGPSPKPFPPRGIPGPPPSAPVTPSRTVTLEATRLQGRRGQAKDFVEPFSSYWPTEAVQFSKWLSFLLCRDPFPVRPDGYAEIAKVLSHPGLPSLGIHAAPLAGYCKFGQVRAVLGHERAA